jgi:hypothetical protein
MQDKLKQLLIKDKINKSQYDLFSVFGQDFGAEFLKNKLLSIALEESPCPSNDGFAWLDGRRSVWRDIQQTISYIHQLIEENSGDNHES